MKKIIIIIAVVFWGIIGANENLAHRQVVSGYFYNDLRAYGSWIEIDYGVVVWRPTIIRVDWSPYRDGRWIWTSDGWYWDSYEPFGYITYHYGRWYFDDHYGWLWYPDYEWAPAWVEWRYDDDYIGWAPLHPYALFSISLGIHFTTTYYTPYYHWNFVTYHYFYDPYVYNHCVGPRYKYRIYSNTRYRTNYVYHNGRVRNYGVDVEIVKKRTGYNIRQRNLESVSDPRALDNRRTDKNGNVRTFYKSRDELVRNEVRDVNFERSERKSSLDVTKLRRNEVTKRGVNTSVEMNRDTEFNRRNTQKDSFNKKDRTSTDRNIGKSGDRNNSGNDNISKQNDKRNVNKRNLDKKVGKKKENKDIKRNSTIDNKKNNRLNTDDKKKRQEVNTNRNNTRKKQEVKVNRNITQKKREVKVNRNNTQKRQEVKVNRNNTQKKTQVKVNRNNTRQKKDVKVNRNTKSNLNKKKGR